MLFELGIRQPHRLATRLLSVCLAFLLAVAGLVSVGTVATAAPSDTIIIKDPHLRAAINEELWQHDNARITRAQAESLTQLEASYSNISDLSGIENFTNLRKLVVHDNFIQDISPLAKLTKLEDLNLGANRIKNITQSAKHTKFIHLQLGFNKISNIKPLSKLTKLRILHLSRNKIESIAPLAKLTKLKSLSLDRNQITSLKPLAKLKRLDYLSASGQRVSLPTVKQKKWVKNPVRGSSGSMVKVKSSSSGFKTTKKTDKWQFTKTGSKEVTWKVKLDSYNSFSGTAVQKVKN